MGDSRSGEDPRARRLDGDDAGRRSVQRTRSAFSALRRSAGSTSLIEPCSTASADRRRTASARRSRSRSSRRPRARGRRRRRPGRPAGSCRRRGTGRPRPPTRIARSITSGTSCWPNEIVSLLRMPPQSRHGGSSSPARTRSSTCCIGPRMPQPQHMNRRIVPCTSITRSGELPASWCSSSMFCVMSACSLPRLSSSTSARWPAFGLRAPRRARQAVLPRGLAHLGIGQVVVDVGHLLGVRILGPHALRAAEVRNARVGRDAGAGEHDDALGVFDPCTRPSSETCVHSTHSNEKKKPATLVAGSTGQVGGCPVRGARQSRFSVSLEIFQITPVPGICTSGASAGLWKLRARIGAARSRAPRRSRRGTRRRRARTGWWSAG